MSRSALSEEEVFAAAVDLVDPAARRQYLDSVCSDDERLRARVEELLQLHDTADNFLQSPAVSLLPDDGEKSGDLIDRYRLVEVVGEGGFGVVWRAEQEQPVRRDVAVKIMRSSRNTQHVIQRFEAERQTLAMMSHVNIATILDAGTTDSGRPYFVMELVEGEALDTYCDGRNLTLSERLELFAVTCRAVHHAHQKGVIHRDLKPSNVLVAEEAGHPVVKVIDFGVAKAIAPAACATGESMTDVRERDSAPDTEEDTSADPAETQVVRGDQSTFAGRLIVGTPEYMSPEQVRSEPDIDTRADVYALGGILYKLLAGEAPLRLSRAARNDPSAITEAICEAVPVAPTARARQQPESTDERPPRNPENRDLDAIALKALSKDRSKRYESAMAVADDIDRHLTHQPVAARNSNLLYVLGRFMRRNRGVVAASALVLLTLTGGIVAAMVGFLQAQDERDYADLQWRRAESERDIAFEERANAERQKIKAMAETERANHVASMLQNLIGSTDPEHGIPSDFTLRQQLDLFADVISRDRKLNQQPDIKASLMRTIGRSYLTLRELDKANHWLTQAMEVRQKLVPPDPERLLESQVDYIQYLKFARQFKEARDMLADVLPKLRSREPGPVLVQALMLSGAVATSQFQFDTAATRMREAWTVSQDVHGNFHPTTLFMQSFTAAHSCRSSQLPEAREASVQLGMEALKLLQEHAPHATWEISNVAAQVAAVLLYAGRFDEAEQYCRQAVDMHTELFGRSGTFTIRDLTRLARILRCRGEFAESESTAREAVMLAESSAVERDFLCAEAYTELMRVIRPVHPVEAGELQRKRLEARRRLGVSSQRVARDLHTRAIMFHRRGDQRNAEDSYHELLAALMDMDSPTGMFQTYRELADFYFESGDIESALACLDDACAANASDEIMVAQVNIDRIFMLLNTDRTEVARAEVKQLSNAARGNASPQAHTAAEMARAQMLLAERNSDEARSALESVLDSMPGQARLAGVRIWIRFLLAECDIQAEDFNSAETLLLEADRQIPRNRRFSLEQLRLMRRLTNLYTAWGKPKIADEYRERMRQ